MASPVNTEVTYITDKMLGAPVLNGVAGALIGVYDAFLVNGFGLRSVSSIVVAGGIATITVPSNAKNLLMEQVVIEVSGVEAPMTDLNGRQKIQSCTTNQFTILTDLPDGTATGTITVKNASAGWEKVFSGTNKAVYRSQDPRSSKRFIRIDDTNATLARVIQYENMSDINTGTGLMPTTSQLSGGGYFVKSYSASATVVPYTMVSDAISLTQAINWPAPAGTLDYYKFWDIRGWGDAIPFSQSGDIWCNYLSTSGSQSQWGNLQYGQLAGSGGDGAYTSGFVSVTRTFAGVGNAIKCNIVPEIGQASGLSGDDTTFGAAPNNMVGKIFLSRVLLREIGNDTPRAIIPGVRYVPQTVTFDTFATQSIISGGGVDNNKKFITVSTSTQSTSTTSGIGVCFIDITGPWR